MDFALLTVTSVYLYIASDCLFGIFRLFLVVAKKICSNSGVCRVTQVENQLIYILVLFSCFSGLIIGLVVGFGLLLIVILAIILVIRFR